MLFVFFANLCCCCVVVVCCCVCCCLFCVLLVVAGPPCADPLRRGPPSAGPPSIGPPPRTAQNFPLFSLSRPFSFFFCLSLGVFSLNFGGVFEGRDPQMCTFGLSGCRVKPRRLRGRPQRDEKSEIGGGTERKIAKFWALHHSGPHPSGPHHDTHQI